MANGELTVTPSDVSVPKTAIERGISCEQWNTIRNALYPGKSDQMVLLAIDYCRARGLDPIKKPVHIVPTWDEEAKRYVESIWEGINSHRVTAARTGFYSGQDEPSFGPMITRALGGAQVTFPEWCKVTVYRLVHGHKCAFTSLVFWLETYARRNKEGTPNRMWQTRPYGQIAKCAEAEALRKAFPEELGGRPTAEEMEGRLVSEDDALPHAPVAATRTDALEAVIVSEAGKLGPNTDATVSADNKSFQAASSSPWSLGAPQKIGTARIPLASTTGDVRYFADIKTWCDALSDLADFEDPYELWNANVTAHTLMMQKASEHSRGYLKAVSDHMALLVRDSSLTDSPGA